MNFANAASPPSAPVSAEFPLSMGDILQKPQESHSFVIFGASGDLTRRKLIPALYNLACADLLPPDFHVVGFAVTPMNDDSFRESMRGGVLESKEANPYDAKVWDAFAKNLHYITADFHAPDGYEALKGMLETIEKRNENPRQSPVLSRDAAAVLRGHRDAAGGTWACQPEVQAGRRLVAHHYRKAVRGGFRVRD